MSGLAHDLRLAVRTLARRPAFTLAATLTLALGLGVNVVAFSAVNALLFKGHAGTDVPGAGWIFTGAGSAGLLSLDEVESLAGAATSLDVAAEGRRALPSWRDGAPVTVWSLVIVGPYFEQLGAQPLAGRLPAPGDGDGPPDGSTPVATLRSWDRASSGRRRRRPQRSRAAVVRTTAEDPSRRRARGRGPPTPGRAT
ncbi:MAG: hypothetical protein ACLGHP_06470, partial [Vicinamibacteria bacterium]